MAQSVAPGGGGDGGAVGEQQIEPGPGRGPGDRRDGTGQRVAELVAARQPVQDQRPQERRVAAGRQPQQFLRRQLGGQRGERVRPAATAPLWLNR